MAYDLKSLLKTVVEKNASDLHITSNWPPSIRIDEKLIQVSDKPMTPEEVKSFAYAMLTKKQIEIFENNLELDFSFTVEGMSHFRVNMFFQRNNIGIALRRIPFEIMNFEECGLPADVVTNLCKRQKGLVLVTGATGSGKSTTLASMVDYINSERPCHIITIEDPIEFVHKNKKSVIEQREVYTDTQTFPQALKHVLRQDPNVILIGEMRDLETIESALVIAETGHLVFATLHTSDATQTINRIIDVFPAHQQQQIRTQLSFVLLAVLSQQLIPNASGEGRVLATEILISNPAIRSLIREAKPHQIYSVLQTSQKEGMKTMNQTLHELYTKKFITYEEAFNRSSDTEDLARLFKK